MKTLPEQNTVVNKELILNSLRSGIATAGIPEQLQDEIKHEVVNKPVIFIGTGTCGLGAGAGKTMDAVSEYLKAASIDAEIIEVGCIGICAFEPIMDIKIPGKERISFKEVTADKVKDILDDVFTLHLNSHPVLGQYHSGKSEKWEGISYLNEHPFFAPQERIVLKNCGIINPVDINEYIVRGGYSALLKATTKHTSTEVIDIIEKSGLRGRGGGGFSTGRKWRMAHESQGEKKYLICNADEGDPGAFMDRAVIEGDPHRLIEGMCIAAYAIGADKGYVYIRAEYPLAIKRLEIALAQAKEYKFLGANIFNSGFDFNIIIKKGAGAFVCGEETALINSIEGRRGMPKPRPPYPASSGLFGKPTIINNVETLSNVSAIVGQGHEWFSAMGTEKSKGTKVFALSGKVNLTGLVEVPMGTTLREVVFTIGAGVRNNKKFKAVQIGGPSGGCITEANLDIQIDYESLIAVGAMMGSGGLVVMDEETCMVDIAKFFMDFIQKESCGKCIPCREGTRRMLEILENITRKPGTQDGHEALDRFRGVITIEKLAQVIRQTSLCGLGQSAPNPVLSTLRWFREEYEEHIYERKCAAGVCKDLRLFFIKVEACTGCTVCTKKCPTGAIIGNKKSPHFIVEDKCIGCGACYDACKFDAIVIK